MARMSSSLSVRISASQMAVLEQIADQVEAPLGLVVRHYLPHELPTPEQLAADFAEPYALEGDQRPTLGELRE